MIFDRNLFSLPQSQQSKLSCLPDITETERVLLSTEGEFLKLKKKTFLFNEGDPASSFFIILSGGVKLTRQMTYSNVTHQTVVDIVLPGSLIGTALVLNESQENKFPINGIALVDSEILVLSKKFYHNNWKQSSNFLALSQDQLVKRIKKMQLSQCLQRLTAEKKLAFLLTEIIPLNCDLPLTRSELSDCIGSTTESVIRTLSRWNREKIIQTKNKKICILDFNQLKKIWQADPQFAMSFQNLP